MKTKSINKIVIVGSGFVGSTTAYTLMLSGLISEIVLIDINNRKAEGEAMDMNHGMPFGPSFGIVRSCGASLTILSIIGFQPPKCMMGRDTTINSMIAHTRTSLMIAVYVGPLIPLKKV